MPIISIKSPLRILPSFPDPWTFSISILFSKTIFLTAGESFSFIFFTLESYSFLISLVKINVSISIELLKSSSLELLKSDYLDELHPEYYGFKKDNYDKTIILNGVINRETSTAKEILKFFVDMILFI